MNDRLQQFLAAENINQAQFADSIGVARASVSHILAGRNKPGYDFLLNMMRRYPELNIEWLLSGTGKMYKSRQNNDKKPVSIPSGGIDLFNGLDDLYESALPSSDADGSGHAAPGQTQTTTDMTSALSPQTSASPQTPGTASSAVQESRNPVQLDTSGPNTAATERKNSENTAQPPHKQRSAVKIVIFYDDNTFQEF